MAVLVFVNGKGVKKQDYENLRKEVGWEQNQPKGVIIHIAGVDAAGDMQVADVWETEGDFNNFVNTRLAPGYEKFKLPQPAVSMFPVYNTNVFEQIEQFRSAGATQ